MYNPFVYVHVVPSQIDPNGCGIRAAREELLANLFFSLRYILVRLEKGFPQGGHDEAVA
jgi:hypothetical protein